MARPAKLIQVMEQIIELQKVLAEHSIVIPAHLQDHQDHQESDCQKGMHSEGSDESMMRGMDTAIGNDLHDANNCKNDDNDGSQVMESFTTSKFAIRKKQI